jgi:Stage II sporulation protein E (SpoIIE)
MIVDIGLLLAVGVRESSLDVLARQAAAAINLAESYTDVFAFSRRRKAISAAAEIQQNLLPPRVVQMSGAALARTVLPSYDVGGDWFDYAENSDGAWIALADATGKGAAAASLSALALGAFRASRRSGANLEQAVTAMHEAVSSVNEGGAVVTAIIGRWHGPRQPSRGSTADTRLPHSSPPTENCTRSMTSVAGRWARRTAARTGAPAACASKPGNA